MALIHVPTESPETILKVLSAFLQGIYKIGLKWENHEKIAQLCESEFDTTSSIFLHRKGIVLSLQDDLRADFEWQRWLATSVVTKCQTGPEVHLPSTDAQKPAVLLQHGGLYCQCKVTGLGCGWHSYPPDWWKGSVKGFLYDLSLTDTIPFADIDLWYRQAKECRGRCSKESV